MAKRVERRTVDLSGYPDLVVIYLGMRVNRLMGLKTRGYFFYVPQATSDAPAIVAIRSWLMTAGSLAESEFPTDLTANRG